MRAGEAWANRVPEPETVNDSLEDRLAAVERRLAEAASPPSTPAPKAVEKTAPESEAAQRVPNAETPRATTQAATQVTPARDKALEELDRRLSERISWLENEVSGHSEAIADLRTCSLRNEESVRRLLGGIERLINAQGTPHPAPLRTVKPSGSSAA
jgi:hypothetical protein